MTMTKREILDLLKSGDFTIAYHDNGLCSLYKGRIKEYDQLPEWRYDKLSSCGDLAEFFDTDSDGYLPKIVALLVEALGGIPLTI